MQIVDTFLLLLVLLGYISTAYGDYVADVTASAAKAANLAKQYAAAGAHKTQKVYNVYVPPVATETLNVIKNTVGESAKVRKKAAAEAAKLAKQYATAQKTEEVLNKYDLPIAQTGIKETQVHNAYVAPTATSGAEIVKWGAESAIEAAKVGSEYAEVLSEKAAEVGNEYLAQGTEKLKEYATEYVDEAIKQGKVFEEVATETIKRVKEFANEAVKATSEYTTQAGELLQEKIPEALEAGKEFATKAIELVQEYGKEALEKTEKYAEQVYEAGKDKAEELLKDAKKKLDL